MTRIDVDQHASNADTGGANSGESEPSPSQSVRRKDSVSAAEVMFQLANTAPSSPEMAAATSSAVTTATAAAVVAAAVNAAATTTATAPNTAEKQASPARRPTHSAASAARILTRPSKPPPAFTAASPTHSPAVKAPRSAGGGAGAGGGGTGTNGGSEEDTERYNKSLFYNSLQPGVKCKQLGFCFGCVPCLYLRRRISLPPCLSANLPLLFLTLNLFLCLSGLLPGRFWDTLSFIVVIVVVSVVDCFPFVLSASQITADVHCHGHDDVTHFPMPRHDDSSP